MDSIYKFKLHEGKNLVSMPFGSIPLSVAYQGKQLTMWAEVSTPTRNVKYPVYVFKTGEDIHHGYPDFYRACSNFLGTVEEPDVGQTVRQIVHVYYDFRQSREVHE